MNVNISYGVPLKWFWMYEFRQRAGLLTLAAVVKEEGERRGIGSACKPISWFSYALGQDGVTGTAFAREPHHIKDYDAPMP